MGNYPADRDTIFGESKDHLFYRRGIDSKEIKSRDNARNAWSTLRPKLTSRLTIDEDDDSGSAYISDIHVNDTI